MADFQTGVALKRIEKYLEEDEVDEQVSSIKKACAPHVDGEDDTLSIENGFFKWNEVPETPEENSKAKGKNLSRISSSDESATAVDSEVTSIRSSPEDHRFELKDISIRFPEGELSVITGPTASGKTALLVSKVPFIEYKFHMTLC
jgi:ABC-type multidrug transport system fused ATPase/permease subunit